MSYVLAPKGLVMLVAVLACACAVEVAEGAPEIVVEGEHAPIGAPGDRGGRSECAPVIAIDHRGNPYLAELACPLPRKPSPDPEQTQFSNLHGEWVTGETVRNSVH
jgi:hypothetical protein